jgi:5-methylcytosine-specific restriction endonuclease McrA
MEYQDYLKSEHWQKTRKATLPDRNYQCENCGRRGAPHVHHLTYTNLGAERPEDLEVLCRACHIEKHTPDACQRCGRPLFQEPKNWSDIQPLCRGCRDEELDEWLRS